MRKQLVCAALVSMVAACNGSDFTGATKKEAAKLPAAVTKPAPDHSVDNSQNATGDTPQTIYVPVGGQKASGLPGACQAADTTIATCAPGGVFTGQKVGTTTANVGGKTVHVVVYNPASPPAGVDGANSGPGDNTGQGVTPSSDSANSGQPDSSLGNILGGLLGVNNAVVTTQPNPDTVNFGGDKVFHIGDANMDGSSCLLQISTFSLSGTVYWFNFVVTKPGTNVTIKINTICGVDYPDTNFIAVVPGGSNSAAAADWSNHQALPVGATSATTIGANLQPGTYALAVKSTKGSSSTNADPGDHDDFIVGNISVQADQPIQAGQVVATKDDDCHTTVDPTGAPCTNAPVNSGGNGINFGGGNSGGGTTGGGATTGAGGGLGSAP